MPGRLPVSLIAVAVAVAIAIAAAPPPANAATGGSVEAIKAAIRAYYDAFADGRYRAACDRMTLRARARFVDDVESIDGPVSGGCRGAHATLRAVYDQTGIEVAALRRARLSQIVDRGSTATAVVQFEKPLEKERLDLKKTARGWRLDDSETVS